MRDGIVLALAVYSAYLAFALFACASERHWNMLAARHEDIGSGQRKRLRIAAWGLVAVSGGLALWRDAPAFGSIVWAMLAMAAAVAVAMTLTWRPAWLKMLLRPCIVLLRI